MAISIPKVIKFNASGPAQAGPHPPDGPARAIGREPITGLATPGSLTTEIWRAIEEQRIVVHYQPQYDLATGQIVSVEALARISREGGDLLYPHGFIAEAEENGLIVGLNRAVTMQACRDFAHWRSCGAIIERVAVNLSANQLNMDLHFMDFVSETLVATGLGYADIEFELTERQLLESDSAGMDTLTALGTAGSRLALDDFGSGFSSLSYLTANNVHSIKLDRTMVRWLPEHHTTGRIVQHLLQLADELGLQVIAEGVEFRSQYDFLADSGCHLAQGFYLAPPLPHHQLLPLITP
jgi:EAL domain-containing protein (putative c-di-GMP-specific phosphodiesterase class I)